MAESPLPPEATGAGLLAGLALLWKLLSETLKLAAERQKLNAERQKLVVERDTADMLGDKAMAEARNAGVLELANILAAVRLEVQDLRAQLEEERDDARAFRSAVLAFIAEITTLLPEMSGEVRVRVQGALDRLRTHESWRHD